MGLKEQIQSDLVTAMKAKDSETSSALRMVKAEILNREKAGSQGTEVSDDDIMALLQSMIKRGRDAAAQFRTGDRIELAEKEESEIKVMQTYLPAEVSADEMRPVIEKIIAEVGATSPKDLGKVMGKAISELKKEGKLVEGGKVREVASELLTSSS